MNPHLMEVLATSLFAVAVLHTFLVSRFQAAAARYPQGSLGENLFHLLGEVEVVFGLWAAVLVSLFWFLGGSETAIQYLEAQNYTEPLFVFAIMAVSATRPIIQFVGQAINALAKLLPLPRQMGLLLATLTIGPLGGSLITEPAAMTVTALILKETFFDREISPSLRYGLLAVLFVNISIGGVLTHFAAPPVVMVANHWEWDTPYLFSHFGWKAVVGVVTNSVALALIHRRELTSMRPKVKTKEALLPVPLWLVAIHLFFIVLVVLTAHHMVVFIGIFIMFLGVANVTMEYQEEIKLRESFLVGFFLAGLVVFGALQRWWLEPLITQLQSFTLFLGATALTAITDNAALTYLGSQVPAITPEMKYSLVAGAVTGGGLTVIANAPNPAGFSILQSTFGKEGISPLRLLLFAVPPTLVAAICFWCLP